MDGTVASSLEGKVDGREIPGSHSPTTLNHLVLHCASDSPLKHGTREYILRTAVGHPRVVFVRLTSMQKLPRVLEITRFWVNMDVANPRHFVC